MCSELSHGNGTMKNVRSSVYLFLKESTILLPEINNDAIFVIIVYL